MSDAFDFANPPFDRLGAAERDKVRAATDIAYYRAGEALVRPGQPMEHLFVVLKGLVAVKEGDEVVTVHGSGDAFGAMALLHGKDPQLFEAQEETLCHLLPKQLVLDLCRGNARFEQFFTHSISERIAARAEAASARGMAGFMVAKVGEAYLHPPLIVPGDTGLRDAALAMKRDKATSLLVEAGDGRIGILSGTDIRDAAVIDGQPLDAAVEHFATFDTITVDADEFLFNAQVLMTRHGIRRLPVLRDGAVIGVLELIDLLGYMSSHSHLVAVQIDRACSVDDLRKAAQSLGPLLQGLHGSGVKIRFIAEMVSDLSRKIQRKLFELLAPADLLENACLIVMGSEGRGEQIAKTDQDNALILRDGLDPNSVRAVCERFTDAMISFGYPPCPGAMMVRNPDWTKTESAFADDIYHWIVAPGEKAFLNLAAFIDAAAVAGDPTMLDRLKTTMHQRMSDSAVFLSHFARPVLAFDTPIGFFHQLLLERGDHKGELDVKKGGIFPVVHGIRTLALERRLTAANTFDRIKALADINALDPETAEDLTEALQFLMEMRLHARLQKGAMDGTGTGADDYIRADHLSKLQHDALKDSLLIVKQFKQLLSHHFRLGAF